MQVTTTSAHLTHATISAGETISMGISDDPMFFQMMFATLYTRETEASVRETLSNAWDAHIMMGITDVPIQISLDDDYLSIRDFGPGIAHDKIGEIYLTLGKSTKKNSSNETGGFGLGCKAPFAYSDHFEVRSYHNGTCTIYSMTKSSLENGGKPGAVVIASFPSDNTGLQVRIPVCRNGSKPGKLDLRSYLKRLVFLGGIKACFEMEELPVLDLSTQPGSFIVSDVLHHKTMTSDRLCVRYGSVVYPIPDSEEFQPEYRHVVKILDSISGSKGLHKIIFQAAPNSICIPPSREMLSLQPLTCETVKKLLNDFYNAVQDKLQHHKAVTMDNLFNAIVESIQKSKTNPEDIANPRRRINPHIVLSRRNDDIWSVSNRLTIKDGSWTSFNESSDVDYIAKKVAWTRLTGSNLLAPTDFTRRIKAAATLELIPARIAKQFELNFNILWQDLEARHDWLMKYIYRPILKQLNKEPLLDPRKLSIVHRNKDGYTTRLDTYSITDEHWFHYDLVDMFNALRNIVVLTYSKTKVIREQEFDFINSALPESYGLNRNYLIYVIPRKKEVAEAARRAFTKAGVTLLDTTIQQDQEATEAARARNAAKPPKLPGIKASEGYIKASKALVKYPNGRASMNTDYLVMPTYDPQIVIEKPLWVARRERMTDKLSNSMLENLGQKETGLLIEAFGDVGVIAKSSTQYDALIKKGAKPLLDYAAEQVMDKLDKCADRIESQKSLLVDPIAVTKITNSTSRSWFRTVMETPRLRKHFGIPKVKGRSYKDDPKWLVLLEILNNSCGHIENKILVERISLMHSRLIAFVKPAPELVVLMDYLGSKTELLERLNSNVRLEIGGGTTKLANQHINFLLKFLELF